ncbi:hypothetical protein DFH11DRAFT_1499342 [Phellopilus nigrolimitatus]|nr:hypothetical protein DFH11DRAFT_1499342 [Phellopilus nigrolimitatus]
MSSSRAETDPKAPVQAGSSSSPGPSSPGGRPRQSRIHFPADADPNAPREAGPYRPTGGGLRSLEPRHLQTLPSSGTSPDDDEFFAEHRRVRSANTSETSRHFGSYSRAQFVAGSSRSGTPSKRTVSYSRVENPSTPLRNGTLSVGSSPLAGSAHLPTGDDATAMNTDPNILADLRRALQYKSRVEQQLKHVKSNSELYSSFSESNALSKIPAPNPFLSKTPLAHSEPGTPDKAEFVDFSPSVGRVPLHPVPTSANDGATLDWSGTASDEEKRERKWTMPLSRKSSKDKYPALARKGIVEKQESLYSDKIARIKDKANAQTLRKAEITRDQLQRRYAVLNASSMPNSNLNLASIARWFSKQDGVVKALIDEAEPFSWLRHLLNKRGNVQRQRSPWNLSALIVDEYVRSNSNADFTHSLSQNSSMVDVVSNAGSAPVTKVKRSLSRPTSFRSVDHISMRRKSDDLISFEPMIHSRRSSDSRISVETQLRRWRNSFAGGKTNADGSSQSSLKSRRRIESVEFPTAANRTSPTAMRSPLQNVSLKKQGPPTPQNSDDGHSSAIDSLSEGRKARVRDDRAMKKHDGERKRSRFHLSLDLRSASMDDIKYPTAASSGPLSFADLRTDALQPTKNLSLPTANEARASTGTLDPLALPNRQDPPSIVLNSVRTPDPRKGLRLALPPSFHHSSTSKGKVNKKRSEAQDHALHVEYTRKKETLDALKARNGRMKLLLQTASRSIIEYDDTQHAMSEKLGLSYSRLPPEILEAFSHDPAAVTANTRRLKGWRAVEDIYLRCERQRAILKTFVASMPSSVTPLTLPANGIYEDATTTLANLVERLYNQRSAVLFRVRETNELLSKIKKMRDELKPEFDAANQYTSANYPELIRLETLLDEFVNEKNQLWKIGEASLSFVLTSAAPLMKTFGRPIWDELHDFLVIPLYRNGFSGEDQWYPVSFPKRSPVLWLRILLAAVAAPLCLQFGVHFFIDLLTQGYLLRVPSFIPSFTVYLTFSGVMCAYAISLLVLLVAVLCELFIILWWSAWLLCIVR